MNIESKEDLIVIRQGLLHVVTHHSLAEEIETDIMKLNTHPDDTALMQAFHKKRKERAKNLINAIDINLENLATKEKSLS